MFLPPPRAFTLPASLSRRIRWNMLFSRNDIQFCATPMQSLLGVFNIAEDSGECKAARQFFADNLLFGGVKKVPMVYTGGPAVHADRTAGCEIAAASKVPNCAPAQQKGRIMATDDERLVNARGWIGQMVISDCKYFCKWGKFYLQFMTPMLYYI